MFLFQGCVWVSENGGTTPFLNGGLRLPPMQQVSCKNQGIYLKAESQSQPVRLQAKMKDLI